MRCKFWFINHKKKKKNQDNDIKTLITRVRVISQLLFSVKVYWKEQNIDDMIL